MKEVIAKNLKGKEFEIELAHEDWSIPKGKHRPDIIIASFLSFGLGSRLRFEETEEEDGYETDFEGARISKGDAVVTNVYDEDGKVIIEAEKQIKDEDKKKLLDKIIKKIDFEDALNDNIFVEILSNVFTKKQLQIFLEKEDLEILLFNGLMYLKVEDRAYRL